MAEIEFSVLNKQGLPERVPDLESMRREVKNWVNQRNNEKGKIDWQFTTKDARVKLKRLYPKLQH
jgi:hypothetical protein